MSDITRNKSLWKKYEEDSNVYAEDLDSYFYSDEYSDEYFDED